MKLSGIVSPFVPVLILSILSGSHPAQAGLGSDRKGLSLRDALAGHWCKTSGHMHEYFEVAREGQDSYANMTWHNANGSLKCRDVIQMYFHTVNVEENFLILTYSVLPLLGSSEVAYWTKYTFNADRTRVERQDLNEDLRPKSPAETFIYVDSTTKTPCDLATPEARVPSEKRQQADVPGVVTPEDLIDAITHMDPAVLRQP